MAAILQATFSCAFSQKKIFVFGFDFHQSLFLSVECLIIKKSALVEEIGTLTSVEQAA